jgi:NAD(P)-dependent dehydrogenase (short-subunit alcohol dehydrogenase family)
MQDLSDKTILVTGASKGIGAAIARRLGEAGANVVAHYGSDKTGAVDATRDIDAAKKLLVHGDFTNLDDVEELWEEAERWQGRIDVLVNNAAIMQWHGGFDAALSDWDATWDKTMQVNVLAPARLLRRAVGHFLANEGGAIITISSWAAQKGVTNPDTIAYGASKSAIKTATQTIAQAYARQGILAYVVAPGVVRTRLSEEFAATQGGEQIVTDRLAMGEWVPPAEVGALVAFLATGRARHLTGATLDVNGASYVR